MYTCDIFKRPCVSKTKVCSSTGNIEVHFVRYADTCKEDFGLECEPYFKFCLSRPQTGSLSVSRSSCHYGYASSNGHFHGSEQIDLLHLTNILGLSNPWSVKVLKFYDPEIMLAMDVYDKDRFTRDDHLVRFGMKLRLNVSHSKSVAEWERVTMFAHNSKYEHRLDFKIRIYCDENYYSPSCFVNCKAQDNANGHYTCDQKTGSKICKEGKVCEDIEDPCLSEPCLNGGHCFSLQELPPKFICLCAEGWDGLYCSVKQDPCDDYPCQNMGICMSYNAKTSYSCNCSYPYTGAHCERVLTTTIAATTTATTVAPDTTSIIVPSITKAKLTTTVASSSTTVKRPDSDSFTTEGFRTTENYEEPSTEDNSQGQPSSTASTTKPIEGPQEENDGIPFYLLLYGLCLE
ncbi:delta-like protein [Plakobranchus ocellatus]|uniref:Delta-like protein n=1 Tax=Plakobranchus ocellatus TaxID=259542 RepID=A0AAV4AG46_9GAST|nr:delta-like protein [Plakobranchus ocellatus]